METIVLCATFLVSSCGGALWFALWMLFPKGWYSFLYFSREVKFFSCNSNCKSYSPTVLLYSSVNLLQYLYRCFCFSFEFFWGISCLIQEFATGICHGYPLCFHNATIICLSDWIFYRQPSASRWRLRPTYKDCSCLWGCVSPFGTCFDFAEDGLFNRVPAIRVSTF